MGRFMDFPLLSPIAVVQWGFALDPNGAIGTHLSASPTVAWAVCGRAGARLLRNHAFN
jgi:hypothetical protein